MYEQVYVCYEFNLDSETYEVVKVVRNIHIAEAWLEGKPEDRSIEKMDLE